MGTLDVRGVLQRRWRLVAAGLVCTLCVGIAAAFLVSPAHRVTSSVLLLPPPAYVPPLETTDEPGNPLLALGGLDAAVSVLITRMNSSRVQDSLVGGTGSQVEVSRQIGSSAPILVVTATSPDEKTATAVRDRAMSRLPIALEALQSEASTPRHAQIRSIEIVAEGASTRVWGAWARGVIGVVGVGVVLTLAVAALVDGLRRTVRSNRGTRGSAEEKSDAEKDDHGSAGPLARVLPPNSAAIA